MCCKSSDGYGCNDVDCLAIAGTVGLLIKPVNIWLRADWKTVQNWHMHMVKSKRKKIEISSDHCLFT